jgi:hypothetical protein
MGLMVRVISESVGRAGGALLAPITASFSAARRARMFHPSGIVVRAHAVPCTEVSPWRELGERLGGPAILRLSSAWWKTREWRDVLGCAIRFTHRADFGHQTSPDDQDLLFATIKRPWTMALAPLSTDHRDFLANDYFAVSPFRTPDTAEAIEWRLSPDRYARREGASRAERLERAIATGEASLVLEARPYRRVIDIAAHREFHPVSRLALREIVDIDQDALRFDPFLDGRGIVPIGAIHALRIAAYKASQWARPAGGESHREPAIPGGVTT